ncbi:hypothetical protein NEOLEDRAFT_1246010 [Neolentinus lepideus HHB14362 ss-1]|uniref:Centrosomin N-terminal motif 1 domain-containing protein n=1 Tax=Neolentinus lepideus HHB14362 ss-1 TaxID=1314782 RepID=A0A165N4N5_9AGAM|nr:hypothetical protein NEOLEDRAFT_1246010 [Neolentinus lepideus HHB14362 ss-1]
MAAVPNTRPDTSIQSTGTHPDLSLGSLNSTFSIPNRTSVRVPSASSGTTAVSSAPLSTPSPPAHQTGFSRRRSDEATPMISRTARDGNDDGETGILDTPDREKKWGDDPETPLPGRSKRTRANGAKGVSNLTLRDQEKHIDQLKKDNFNLQLKVHFLEERLAQLAPDQMETALKQNINLKIEVQQHRMELKKLKKLVLEQTKELERVQKGAGAGSRSRELELEEKLEEREREIRELRRRKAVGPEDGQLRNMEIKCAELEEQLAQREYELESQHALLEDNQEEMFRLQDLLAQKGETSVDEAGERRRDRMARRIEELEAQNEDLRLVIDDQAELITQREDEKEDLADMVESLRLQLEDLQHRREAEAIERSESRAQILEEREEREMVEEGMNAVRDKLAAITIELQQKEDELEMKNAEIVDLIGEHERDAQVLEQQWRGEVEEARGLVEELRDVIAERDAESKELRMHIAEYEANNEDLHVKFEAALAHLEQESEEKDGEIEAGNREIERLGQQVYNLEDEIEQLRADNERNAEDWAVERERLEATCVALKDKIGAFKSELQEKEDESAHLADEVDKLRGREDELSRHIEDLVGELRRERESREHAESQITAIEQEHDIELRQERRALEAKESALESALNDLARTQSLLTQRDADLATVQSALQRLEDESKKTSESHTTAKFSMQLEVDRLKRDLDRVEDELARARKELDSRDGKTRERDGVIDKLHAENRDLTTQLAAQTQARLNLSEKLDALQAQLKAAEADVSMFRTRVAELEQRLSKDQRSLLAAEAQYRDQLTERNTLLLTIYQYMDKILGVDKTPKKGSQAETKPYTNFSVFHDNLITRLKQLSSIQLDFDKRCKEVEAKYMEKLTDLKKQLDQRWKQIDKFEAGLKNYADAKASWRRQMSSKEGELEALRSSNSDLTAQLSKLKRPNEGESMEIRALRSRATNAERRMTIAQNQLAQMEERVATTNQKSTAAGDRWEARVKEYEARMKAAEEKVKREKQGNKERIVELENQLESLKRQKDLETKRKKQLEEIMEANKVTSSPAK